MLNNKQSRKSGQKEGKGDNKCRQEDKGDHSLVFLFTGLKRSKENIPVTVVLFHLLCRAREWK